MLVPVREFTSAAELRAAYAQGRRKFFATAAPKKCPLPKEPDPPPEQLIIARGDEGPRYVPSYRALPAADIQGGPSIRLIALSVGAFYGIRPELLIARGKGKREAFARQVVMYLVKVTTEWSFLGIGRRLDRDHTTIMFACKKMSHLACVDIGFAHDLFDIMLVIRASCSPSAHGGMAYGGHRAPAAVGPSAGAPGGVR